MLTTVRATQEFLLTIDHYYKMGEVGIIPHDVRVELVYGKIRHKSPINSPHAYVTGECDDALQFQLRGKAVIRCQSPIRISEISMPEPDLVVAKLPRNKYKKRHPEPNDIYLIIEVADSSIGFDTGEKLELYALASIPEYWVIDLNEDKIRVYRQPNGNKFLFEEIIYATDKAICKSINFQLNAKKLFG